MAIIGYMPLHYGKEYLRWALKSMDIAEKIHIFYTEQPSYGFQTDVKCPESESELMQIALDTSNKVQWHRIGPNRVEGHHRGQIMNFVSDDDWIITLDSDEVMHPGHWESALSEAGKQDCASFGINGFVNFWKSFDYIVRDGFQPVRILRPKNIKRRKPQGTVNATIYHFGYAQCAEIMAYKLKIHGHLGDIRNVHGSPENYFNKWAKWTHPDCGITYLHPASRDIWVDAEPFDKTQLPELLKDHPYYV
jgi:hypothetical protein